MAARWGGQMFTREKAFPELYTDADSDIDDWRDDTDFEPSTCSSEDSETGVSDKGSEQDLVELEWQQQNARGKKKLLWAKSLFHGLKSFHYPKSRWAETLPRKYLYFLAK